ncbi:hypothetical protein HDV63DRAFT_412185 [Trichoderma sp. SZMC 28014]
MVALAGVGVIGATMMLPRKPGTQRNDVHDRRDKAQETRELGLVSTGVGENKMTGGLSSSTTSGPDKDPRYREVDMGDSKQYLPAGGVSTGRGGGGTTASASEKLGFKGSLLGGSGKKIASREDEVGYHDTRGISRMGPELETKKRADPEH